MTTEKSAPDRRQRLQANPAEAASRDTTARDAYTPTEFEPRWQQHWEDIGLYKTDLDNDPRPPFYLLTMYPYPSGDLHIGHWYIVTPTDAISRYRRMT